jgi:hypothetical protein
VSSFTCSNPFVFCSLNFTLTEFNLSAPHTTKQNFVSKKTTSGPNGYWICSKSKIVFSKEKINYLQLSNRYFNIIAYVDANQLLPPSKNKWCEFV